MLTKLKYGVALTAIASVLSSPVLANSFYMSAAGIESEMKSATLDIEDDGYMLSLGYRFDVGDMIDIGLEASYVEINDESKLVEGATLSAESDAMMATLVIYGPSINGVTPFLKGGVADATVKTNIYGTMAEDDDNSAVYGVGLDVDLAAFDLLKNVSVRVEYMRLDVEDTSEFETDIYSLGLVYNF